MRNLKFAGTGRHHVESLEEIAPDVFVLSFERSHSFIPGQVIALSTEEGDPAPRIYSICSGTDDRYMSILFNLVPGGRLTSKLANLKRGDSVYCSAPYGSFFGDSSPAFWIASGTGIAPYISMFRSGLAGNKTLIHGGRTAESFYFQDELSASMKERYIRCISAGEGKDLYKGRLTSYLRSQDSLNPGLSYYLCGSAEMVVETRDLLIEKGVPYNQILSEIYF